MSKKAFDAAPTMAGLATFQRNTVEHVIDRFYGADPTDRFLVADETGLGKTIVAKGVIARTIEELQDDPSVDRVDIVYVCSNRDLASQNLSKLNVTGDKHHGMASRLTLLAKHSARFTPPDAGHLKKSVNLMSFTPGTSFTKGWATGTAEERAMILLLLEDKLGLRTGRARNQALRLLQGASRLENFERVVSNLRSEMKHVGIDRQIQTSFLAALESTRLTNGSSTVMAEFDELLRGAGDQDDHRRRALVGRLREVLARESVGLITPDLVILDEFQRFRELLEPGSEAGELAHHLFNYRQEGVTHGAKVLLLSATPFKPFTYAEEAASGDDHHEDFLKIIEFLVSHDQETRAAIQEDLRRYRDAVISGSLDRSLTSEIRDRLLRLMVRTERPRMLVNSMAHERVVPASAPPPEDLKGFVALKALAKAVKATVSVEYWKSAPYFVNFMDGYKISTEVRAALDDPDQQGEVKRLLRATQHLNFADVDANQPVDPGNQRMRQLMKETVGANWWQLLWMPASLPYLKPSGPFAGIDAMTKRLVFSSWMATPTAVASLLSHEASRLVAGPTGRETSAEEHETDRRSSSRLDFRITTDGRPGAMSTLALFWPAPDLARICDPLKLQREVTGPLYKTRARDLAVAALRRVGLATSPGQSAKTASPWFELMSRGSSPAALSEAEMVDAFTRKADHPDLADGGAERSSAMLSQHLRLARSVGGASQDRRVTTWVVRATAELALHSPGNIAWRALSRLVPEGSSTVTDEGLWLAAARLASSFRTLFARAESTNLLDQTYSSERTYWEKVLAYCRDGNLQAVMDEYLHHLLLAGAASPVTDAELIKLANRAASAISLRPSRYQAFDVVSGEQKSFMAGFALRYGGRREDQESARQPDLREAFNSPFRPFVLASTSVGQEGVDFHRYCHSVFHWNTPANPIDFEQREGRIDRHAGHAVRKNLIAKHGDAILENPGRNPWEKAYDLGTDEKAQLGDFAPYWVYPGDAKVERCLAPFMLSRDQSRLEQIKRDVALYRLTFGQPRQEDMLALIKLQYSHADEETLSGMRLDLTAPPARQP